MPRNPYEKPANVGDYIPTPTPSAPRPVPPFIPGQGGVRPGGALGPSQFQTESDSIAQWIRPGVSQVRFPALPVKANLQHNAVASSAATRVVAPVAAQTAANTTAIQNLANQSIFLGNWSPTVTYAVNNQVLFNSGYYICLALNLNQQPDTHPTFWQLITNQNSSVYEGTYNPATTYQSRQTVSFQGGFWVALNTTTGNTPSTSSSHWTLLGASSVLTGTWGSGASYVPNMQVVYPAGGNMYTCLVANVNKQPDTNPTFWQLVGPSDLDFIADGTVYIRGIGTVASESLTVANNNFEASSSLPVPGWLAQNGATLSYLTSGQQSGNQSLAVQTGGSNGNALSTTKYACQPGDMIYVGGFAKSDGTGDSYIGLRVSDATGTAIALDVIHFGTGTSWSQQFQSYTMPANAVYFQIICLNASATPNCISYFDNIQTWRILNLGNQVVDGPSNFSATASTLTYRPLSNPLTSTDAGGSAKISVAAFVMRTSSKGDISINSGSVTGLSYDTLYYVYYDDSTLAGGSPTYHATTTKTDAINGSGRFFVGSIMTAVSTGPQTLGNSDGGVGAQSGQTAVFSFSTNTNVNSGTAVSGSITNASYDGNPTTKSNINITNVNSSAASITSVVSGAPAGLSPWSSVTLYVRSAVPSNTVNPGASPASITYSYAGGSGTVMSVGPATTRGVTTDSVSLPANINLGTLQVTCSVTRNSGAAQVVELDVYEIYVVALT
jgi:hypothetical protein